MRGPLSEQSFAADWIAALPAGGSATAELLDQHIVLSQPAGQTAEIAVRRKLDLTGLSGHRVRLAARVRITDGVDATAYATLTAADDSLALTYHDSVVTPSVRAGAEQPMFAVLDVPASAGYGELSLSLKGVGTASFGEIELSVLGPSPVNTALRLSPFQRASLATLTRAAALIRYLHPSDQAASVDWNRFLPAAVDRVLHATSSAELLTELRAMFAPLAPTARFSAHGEPYAPATLDRGAGTYLVRWRRHGLGVAYPFLAYREGRDRETSSASVVTQLTMDQFGACKTAVVRLTGHARPGPGKASLLVTVLQPGTQSQDLSASLLEGTDEARVTAPIPSDTQGIEIGIRVEGRAGLEFDGLTWACDGGTSRTISLANQTWLERDSTDLYTWQVATCGSRPCARLERDALPTTFDVQRDVLDQDIGNGITLHLPLSVWADTNGTLPAVRGEALSGDYAIDDVAIRLAAISAAWGALSLFYPYFADQQIDWLPPLLDALDEAAAARTPQETRSVLAHLTTYLKDNHAKVTHPAAPITGILPVMFRRLAGRLVVTGGVPAYLKSIPIGSELEAIDEVPAARLYEQAVAQVSAATDGLRDYLAPARMVMGMPGRFQRVRFRDRDGKVMTRLLPRVSDDAHAHDNREPRPANGTELAPGIYYLDIDALQRTTLDELLPTLGRAAAIVIDFRGYANRTTLDVLSHLTDRPIQSPLWQMPIVPRFTAQPYITGHWDVRPQLPRLSAKIVGLIDGRAGSATETALHVFRNGQLGVLVGEPSAGTNGNVAFVDVPGGFTVRFTGLRVGNFDGSTVHGHGFTPDHLVHPTLNNVREHRDSILESGIDVARRLIGH